MSLVVRQNIVIVEREQVISFFVRFRLGPFELNQTFIYLTRETWAQVWNVKPNPDTMGITTVESLHAISKVTSSEQRTTAMAKISLACRHFTVGISPVSYVATVNRQPHLMHGLVTQSWRFWTARGDNDFPRRIDTLTELAVVFHRNLHSHDTHNP